MNQLTSNELNAIRHAQQQQQFAQLLLEKAQLEKALNDANLKNLHLQLRIKYGEFDSIDQEGHIILTPQNEPKKEE